MLKLRMLSLAALTLSPALSQPTCTVVEHQRQYTVTGVFTIGASTVSVTLPHYLTRSAPAIVYMEVSGDVDPTLSLQSAGQTVAIANGAALRLAPERNVRLTIDVVDRGGRPLCEWAAHVGTTVAMRPVPDGIQFLSRRPYFTFFYTAGDPIFLQVGGRPARESAEFSIDGLPMLVLARNGSAIILKDPRPAPGARTIEAEGYSVLLPFVRVELAPAGALPAGRANLEIKVTGRDRVDLPALPIRRLALFNAHPERLKILCGKPMNYGDPRMLTLTGDGDELSASCKVILLKPGPLDIGANYTEVERAGRLPWPPGLPSPPPRLPSPLPRHSTSTPTN